MLKFKHWSHKIHINCKDVLQGKWTMIFCSSRIENSPSKGFLPAAAAAAMYPPREANGFPGTGAPPWADPGGP